MKSYQQLNILAVPGAVVLAVCLAFAFPRGARAQNTLTNGLVAYWPMDVVTNGTTPDISHGYDMVLHNVQAANFIPSTRGTIGTLSEISAGNAVSFTNAQNGFIYYLGTPGDYLPINLQSNYTINMWINIVGTNQSDLRIFAEDDFNGNSNPLWVVGTGGGGGSAEDANLHWLRRQQSITINGNAQFPDIDTAQNQEYTSLNPCDGNWHMVTITKQSVTNSSGTNVENFEVYVDTVRDPGNSGSSDYSSELDAFGQQAVLMPEQWINSANTNLQWTWLINATSFGGLSRSLTGGNYITGQLDDAAMWNRTLDTNEILALYQYGLTDVVSVVNTGIADFSFDAHQVLYGDSVTLRWSTTHATTLQISPSIGDVTGITANGVGSTNLTITGDATYTLIASRPGSSVTNTASVTVSKVPVAPNWHVIENFSEIPAVTGLGIPEIGWDNVLGDFTGPLDTFSITTLTNTNTAVTISNNVCGTAQSATPRGALSAFLLNGLTVQTNNSNTVFFRVYVADTSVDNNDFSFFLGINDVNLSPLAVSIYDGDGAGARINIERTATGTGGVIDVLANDGVAGYNVVEDGQTNASSTKMLSSTDPAGLTAGVVYDFWIDLFANPLGYVTNADGSTNTFGTLYSVYYKPLGALTRTELFTNLLSDRSPFGTVPPPLPALGQIFLLLDAQAQNANLLSGGTNTIVIDNLYLSRKGLNSSIPVAPGVFPDLIVPTSISLAEPLYLASDPANGNQASVTLSWDSIPGALYTVYKSATLDGSLPWQLVVTELPSGGTTTVFKDTSATGAAAFYKVTSP